MTHHIGWPLSATKAASLLALISFAGAVSAANHVKSEANLTELEVQQLGKAQATSGKTSPRRGLEFRHFKKDTDARGITHSRIKQYYAGLPIWGADLTVHTTADGKTKVYGDMVTGMDSELPSTVPAALPYSDVDALGIASKQADKLGMKLANASQVAKDKIEKIVYLMDDGKPTFAYYVVLNSRVGAAGAVQPNMIIDAQTGDVLKSWDGVAHLKIGTGPGGNGRVGLYEFGTGAYGFLDVTQTGSTCALDNADYQTVDTKGAWIDTLEAAEVFPRTQGAFPCARNAQAPTNGAYSPANDAHYLAGQTIEMYQALLGVKPYPGKLTIIVNITDSFANPGSVRIGTNAAFLGRGVLVVGVGGAETVGSVSTTGEVTTIVKQAFYPLAVPDVIGHEISHGFTKENSGLNYVGVSGALNEAFSDIAGEALEYRVRGKVDWQNGSDALVGNAKPDRYLNTPKLNAFGIEHVSEYSGNDPHFGSGIFNKAFYTLATKPGWSIYKVFQVMGNANRYYWTPNLTAIPSPDLKGNATAEEIAAHKIKMTAYHNDAFNEAACGALRAADDLQYNLTDVAQAFSVVGIACAKPPASISYAIGGHVISKATTLKNAVPSAAITLTGTRGTFPTQTDSDGWYTASVPSGKYTITGTKKGYTFGAVNVTLSTASVLAPALEANTSLAIAGRLIDSSQAAGSPGFFLAGKMVGLYLGGSKVAQRFTDSGGGYEFPALAPNSTYTLQVEEPGWAPTSSNVAVVTTTRAVSLSTNPIGTTKIAGTVKDSSGNPLGGYLLKLTPCGQETTVFMTQTNQSGQFNFSFTPKPYGAATCPLGSSMLTSLAPNGATNKVVPNGSTALILTERGAF